MNRRGFLATCLALAAAPSIVRASSLMPVRPLIEVADWSHPLFTGEAGRYANTIFANDPRAMKVWAAALFADTCRRSYPYLTIIEGRQ